MCTGLAGLRVGYGAFPLSIIEYLWRAKQPYNVSVAAEVAACAALKNPAYLEVMHYCLMFMEALITKTVSITITKICQRHCKKQKYASSIVRNRNMPAALALLAIL